MPFEEETLEMLTKRRIKNFKVWKDSGDIRLALLTVLFGTNSAGKTSIPQLLLLLKQTAASADRQRALQLGDGLEFSARLVADATHQPRTASFRYELRRGDQGIVDLSVTQKSGGQRLRKKAEFDLASSEYPLQRHPGRGGALPAPLRFYGFPDEVAASYQNAAFESDFVLELERMLKSVFHVGPLREYAKRLYLWSGEVPDHVGVKGERAVEAILAAGDRSFGWKSKQKGKHLAQLVAERLKAMGLIHDFQVKLRGQHRKEYEVLVRTHSNSLEVKLTDVGFGVSQVLPVIVECFYVPRRSIVILEQPEVHLHPRVQADLADRFVDAISAREGGYAHGCQFIVESHSEHFLRRLQRRIAEQELSNEYAALYFVHSEGAQARIEELDVDLFGNIKNWPENFFGDEMSDLVARTEAQAKRMHREVGK